MKKLIVIPLLFVFLFICAGCGSATASTPSAPSPTAMPEQAVDTTPASEQETGDTAQNKPTESPVELPSADKALVVYFSATGTTRGVAEKIAALTDAELVEIVPAQPYTTEDLNYNDRSTRATVEQNTPDVRPEIANEISL